MTLAPLSPAPPDTPPLDPTAEHARQQLLQELSKAQYQPGRPTVPTLITDRLSAWFQSLIDWINSLFSGGALGPGSGTVIVVVVISLAVIAALIVGFILFGVPRLNQRSKSLGALFGDEDDRDSTTLRRAAERAAAAGDYTIAIEEEFRSIARGLSERTVVTTFPGTTAHGFAVEASTSFPPHAAALAIAADAFDSVRYLGGAGTETDWLAMRSLEESLRKTRPLLDLVDA
ncbi:MAG: hypothetical protein QOD50_2071 [Actinomycetota bacterium]|nr:hypothetical protein [Actinomycetota bacterium]